MKTLYIVFSVGLVMIIAIYLIISYNNREEVLKRDMREYYEKYLKGKVIGVDTHQISLEMLEKTGYDMKKYKNCDLKKSFSYIKLESKEVIVENHLKCSDK